MSDLPPPAAPRPDPPRPPSAPLPPPPAAAPAATTPPPPPPYRPPVPAGPAGSGGPPPAGSGGPPPVGPGGAGPGAGGAPWWKRGWAVVAAIALVVVGIVGIVIATTGGDDEDATEQTDPDHTSDPDSTSDRDDPDDTGPPGTGTPGTGSGATEVTQPATTVPPTTTRPTLPPVTLPPLPTDPEDTEPDDTDDPEDTVSEEIVPTVTGASGATLTLQTYESVIDATVLGIVDPATPAESGANEGSRLVAVNLRLFNSGDGEYSDAPELGAFLVDDTGSTHETAVFAETTDGPVLGDVRLRPGDVRTGWLTFEVPDDVVVSGVRWVPDIGTSDDVAQWDVAATEEPPPSPPVLAAGVAFGDGVTIPLMDTEVEVRALEIVDPVEPVEADTDEVPTGFHAVAIEIEHVNAGPIDYENDPSEGVVVVDAAGFQYEETPIEVEAGARFDASVTLEPGESVRGFVVFLVPDGVAPVKFQMSLDYGFSPTWAEFDVG